VSPSAVNAFVTWLYLGVALPVLGVDLPLVKTLVAITFIVGTHINARAWELLIAMLVMEAAFGIPGLIAAPIFYAYFKEELRDKGLV